MRTERDALIAQLEQIRTVAERWEKDDSCGPDASIDAMREIAELVIPCEVRTVIKKREK